MRQVDDSPTGAGCCDAFDYTVSRMPTGYLLGQVQARLGPGPWWTYIAIFPTYDEAMTCAIDLANRHGRLAWLHKGGDDYVPLPDQEPPLEEPAFAKTLR